MAADDEISREREGMEVQMQVQRHGFDLEIDEFWPVEHPLEPPDEDRPVKCPMPSASSVLAAVCQFLFKFNSPYLHISNFFGSSFPKMLLACTPPPNPIYGCIALS